MVRVLSVFIFLLSGCGLQNPFGFEQILYPSLLDTVHYEHSQISQEVFKSNIQKIKPAIWYVGVNFHAETNEINHTKKYINNKPVWVPQVHKKEKDIPLSHGSGFFIGPRTLITNFHVIDNLTKDTRITLSRTNEVTGQKIFMNASLKEVSAIYDLAILESEKPVDHYLNVGRTPQSLQVGHPFYLIGYPKDLFIILPLSYEGRFFQDNFLQFNHSYKESLKGSSGGVVVSETGEILGAVHTGSINGVATAVSIKALNDFLNGNSRKCDKFSEVQCVEAEWDFLNKTSQEGKILSVYQTHLGGYDEFKKKRIFFKEFTDDYYTKEEKEEQLFHAQKNLFSYIKDIETAYNNYKKTRDERYRENWNRAVNDYNQEVNEHNRLLGEYRISIKELYQSLNLYLKG